MMFAVMFTLALVLVVCGAVVVFAYDTTPERLAASMQRFVFALVLALTLATTAIVYAAEINPTTCNDLEKYSFWWYVSGCFIYESSH